MQDAGLMAANTTAGMPIKGVKISDFEFFSFGKDRRHIEPHFSEKTK